MKNQQWQVKNSQNSQQFGLESMMPAEDQLKLLELVQAITGVKLTPNMGN